MGWELETENPEEEGSVERLRETCARLIKCAVETIRTRLDRVYLEALDDALRSDNTGHRTTENAAAVQEVQEELESLYAEILPVAQMSAEQQHLEPALKSVLGKKDQKMSRSIEAVHYVSFPPLSFF